MDINSQPIRKPNLRGEEGEEKLMPHADQNRSNETNDGKGKPNGATHSERYTKHLRRIQASLKTYRKKKVKVRPVPPIMMKLFDIKAEILIYRSDQKRVSIQHNYEMSHRLNK